VKARDKVASLDRRYRLSSFSNEATATTRQMSDDELLTMLQEACFRYYWEGAHPVAGTTLENIPGDDRIVATGASGFGIMALIVGVDRGFITRDQSLERMGKILAFLEKAPRYHGVWSHFMDGSTGQTIPVFSMFDNGGDLVETAFLMVTELRCLTGLMAIFQGVTYSGATSDNPASTRTGKLVSHRDSCERCNRPNSAAAQVQQGR